MLSVELGHQCLLMMRLVIEAHGWTVEHTGLSAQIHPNAAKLIDGASPCRWIMDNDPKHTSLRASYSKEMRWPQWPIQLHEQQPNRAAFQLLHTQPHAERSTSTKISSN